MHSDRIMRDARLVVEALPNAEIFAAERSLRQLCGIHVILLNLDDPWLSQSEVGALTGLVLDTGLTLENFLNGPPPPHNISTRTLPPSGRGRPRYALDLDRAIELHDMGNPWAGVADALGVRRQTLYNHLERAGLSSGRRPFTSISDEELDEKIVSISLHHPFAGSNIMSGHLEAIGIHVSIRRIQESLWRVDAIGVLVRWNGVIKRRVYHVRGANALWHMDGNEKLRPWGFYRSTTVELLFMHAVSIYGWPSRMRGDYGKENNGVERRMNARWGDAHRSYIRGRSTQNIRMERGWRDVRKDTLEFFREIFMFLEANDLLDMENPVHRVCLFIVFQPRIQQSLDETISSWNLHKVRTAGNKTPQAIYQLSREKAINRGYWTGDPGDDINTASDSAYGQDPDAPLPPLDELQEDPAAPDYFEYPNVSAEREAGILVNDDDEVQEFKNILAGMDLSSDDGNWGIDHYCQAVVAVTENFMTQ
ncbi:Integrase catalytic domain-containing protein [Mycena sanguinolenta]|uniref:Integrase catalytic domain-containing protein n=1 Tax=Mycena sanguinolenta TaxID=230812 RepID=A0A8H6XZG8_9AGAR|nr:Integrase catalytic domain-containing protein [Mycena sanguinolenta]